MAERVHSLGSNQRLKINTIGTELPAFAEWGGEARRERRRWFLFIPYWSAEGASPNFSVDFIRRDGTVFTETQTGASNETGAGYRKKALVSINAPATDTPSNTAAWMGNVILHYVVDGENKTLAHGSN